MKIFSFPLLMVKTKIINLAIFFYFLTIGKINIINESIINYIHSSEMDI